MFNSKKKGCLRNNVGEKIALPQPSHNDKANNLNILGRFSSILPNVLHFFEQKAVFTKLNLENCTQPPTFVL